ncbi:hypothetical protein KSP35_22060 [Aquihabitans sp. G128]|uniref:hypothetical protein n=1 Tax=Aquihabitans sp. G128 TaxID=2849779 RepID=UPI001C24C1D6|nr:hypothetical protein [Aquihabitans sp. G128]QXC60965.1 hypothetical protein KSP35_22060 [Aquihabitans sp. G128]
MTSAGGSSVPGWVIGPALDLFTDDNRSKVQGVLGRPHAVVFGWQYHFAGGSGRTTVVFTAYAEYLACISEARPGDHFTLYDLDSLIPLAFLQRAVTSTDRHELPEADWELVAQRLRRGQDMVLVRRSVASSGASEVEVFEPTTPEDEWLADLRDAVRSRGGELLGFEAAILDAGVTGIVSSVTPTSGEGRIHALVDAKRPDRDGAVPLSGPY